MCPVGRCIVHKISCIQGRFTRRLSFIYQLLRRSTSIQDSWPERMGKEIQNIGANKIKGMVGEVWPTVSKGTIIVID